MWRRSWKRKFSTSARFSAASHADCMSIGRGGPPFPFGAGENERTHRAHLRVGEYPDLVERRTREGDGAGGPVLRVFGKKCDPFALEVDPVPGEVHHFAPPHPRADGEQDDGVEERIAALATRIEQPT